MYRNVRARAWHLIKIFIFRGNGTLWPVVIKDMWKWVNLCKVRFLFHLYIERNWCKNKCTFYKLIFLFFHSRRNKSIICDITAPKQKDRLCVVFVWKMVLSRWFSAMKVSVWQVLLSLVSRVSFKLVGNMW